MEKKQQVPICVNHLGLFYEAIKEGNLSMMDKLEHELTIEEKCVACAYIFKTHGSVREALGSYLNNSGFAIDVPEIESSSEEVTFWLLRGGILFVILAVVFLLRWAIKYFLLGMTNLSFFSYNLIELSMMILISLVIFLFVDDLFFD